MCQFFYKQWKYFAFFYSKSNFISMQSWKSVEVRASLEQPDTEVQEVVTNNKNKRCFLTWYRGIKGIIFYRVLACDDIE